MAGWGRGTRAIEYKPQQPYLSVDAIRTRYEFYVERLLNFLEIPFFINHILCFTCAGGHFYWTEQRVERCPIGSHAFSKGEFCRPDFILGERGPISVLRIDGEIHDRGLQIKKDRGQERSLRDLKIPFFVSENEFWKWRKDEGGNDKLMEKINWNRIPVRHLDFLLGCWVQTLHSNIYKKYGELKMIRDTKLI
jgi:hypothetical protein